MSINKVNFDVGIDPSLHVLKFDLAIEMKFSLDMSMYYNTLIAW